MKNPVTSPIVIAAAGTGGHIFPGIAVAEELRKLRPEVPVLFLGSPAGMEQSIVSKLGYPLALLPARKIKGQGAWGKLLFLFWLPWMALKSFLFLMRTRPKVIFGTGAYASAVPLKIAQILGIPVVIHESNANPGLTTRLLASKARSVFLNFQESQQRLPHVSTHVVGMPIRLQPPKAPNSFSLPQNARLKIAIIGGSQGARGLNEYISTHLQELLRFDLCLLHQTGEKAFEACQVIREKTSSELKQRWVLTPFVQNMPAVYTWADLLICRAGSSTLAELLHFNVPSLLVPFPFAADQHQKSNAEAFSKQGFSTMIEEKDLASALPKFLKKLSDDPTILSRMKQAIQSYQQSHPSLGQASTVIAKHLLEFT